MGRYCDHEFHCIKHTQGNADHAIIQCAYCGQIRQLHPDGRVVIVVEEGKIEKKRNDHANPSNSNNITP